MDIDFEETTSSSVFHRDAASLPELPLYVSSHMMGMQDTAQFLTSSSQAAVFAQNMLQTPFAPLSGATPFADQPPSSNKRKRSDVMVGLCL
jgi:hypothetical protein